jgi:ribokinase
MQPRVSVVGSANLDFIMQVPHLPARGESVADGEFSMVFGGKGANQAVAAARAGAQVSLVAALGDDQQAGSYLARLQEEGIDTSNVYRAPDMPCGSALIMIDQAGSYYLTVAPGANAHLSPDKVRAAEATVASSDWIILQQEIPGITNHAVLEIAKGHDRPVMFNYAPATDLGLRPGASVHALVVNEIEAAALTGHAVEAADIEAAARAAGALRETGGHRLVVITLGESGAVYADDTGVHGVAAFKVDAVDSTAAGDTFCGALAAALGEGQATPDAMRFASAASALAVTKVGAQPSIPCRRDIDGLLARGTG